MFGSPKPNMFGSSPFGQPQQSTFGKPATSAFGTTPSAFGQQSGSLFGSTQPSAGVFGQTSGGFGVTSTSTFGQPPTTSAFGSFGQPQQPTTSLFGQTNNAQASTSLFGQPSTSGFGAAKPTTGFGFTAPQSSLFGQSQTSTASTFGTFGNTATSAFGQPQTMSGATGTAIAKYQPHTGSDTLVKNGQTSNVSTRQHCITAMKEYDSKCLEELRLEDYSANRKGPQAGSTAGFFGSPPQSTSLFGAPTSQPQSTGLFGTQQAGNTLGGFNTSTSTFGQTAPAFGQPQAQPGLFGAKPANTFGMTSTFGQPPQQQQQPAGANNLFGKPFGAQVTPANTSFGFGQPAANTTTPFGAVKPFGQTTPGIFGQTAPASTGNTFGQANTSFGAFGSSTQTTTSQTAPLFGATTNSGGLFGLTSSAPNTGFGPAFGATTNTAPGSLFGAKPATGFSSTFGTNLPSASTGGFTGLGTFQQPATSSAFGTFGQTNTFNKPAATGFAGFGPSTASALSGGMGLGTNMMGFGNTNANIQQPQQAAVPIHQHILSLATSPYGDNPIFKDLKPLGSNLNEDALKPTNPAAQKAILESSASQYKISPKVSNGIKLKPIGSTLSKKSLFGGLEEFDSSIDESFSLKPNAKRLIIKPKSATSTGLTPNANNTSLQLAKNQEASPLPHASASADDRRLSATKAQSAEKENTRRVSWLHSNLDKVPQQQRADSDANSTIQDFVASGKSKTINVDKTSPGILRQSISRSNLSAFPLKSGLNANDSMLSTKSFLEDTSADLSLINTEPHPAGITLQRSGYFTIPPLDKLVDYLKEDGTCIVPNFTIGRKYYGNVYYSGPIDVANLNLDELVHFRHKEVIIYPDDENKPPIGEGLNRKAQITLDQVWPHDKSLHEPIKDRNRLEEMNYESKLRAVCDKHDTRFVEYRPETGSWVFKVDHFSKYGLTDSDEEDNPADAKKIKPNLPTQDAFKPKSGGALPKAKVNTRYDGNASMRNLKYAQKQQRGLGGHKDLTEDREMEYIDFISPIDQYPPQPISPSTDLAMEMGTDSHKLQLMRASLFNDDVDDFETKSVISDHYGERDSPDQIVPSKRQFTFSMSTHSLLSKEISSTTSSSTIDTPILSPMLPVIREHEPRKVDLITEGKKIISTKAFKPIPFILKPKVAIIRSSETVVSLPKSILSITRNKNFASDLAFYHGRRFKIGWNHANQLTVGATAITLKGANQKSIAAASSLFGGRVQHDASRPVIKLVKLLSLEPNEPKTFVESIENHLKCQLGYSSIETDSESGCPRIEPKSGVAILQNHHQLSEQCLNDLPFDDYLSTCHNIWSLCVALWGHQEELDDIADADHIAIMLRRDLVSTWLENTVTDKELLKKGEVESGYLPHLLKLLAAHKINEACDLAFKNGDMNLSLLLSQSGGSNVVRSLVSKQFESWRLTEADRFIEVHRQKAMMLVAGLSSFESTSGKINIYEDLDWMKSLAVNVWYLCSPTASITDALLKYEEASIIDAKAPLPAYLENYNGDNVNRIQDIRYHILKLYSARGYSLEKLLNPATHTADFMDFRLSWLLLQTLKSIGYHHCSALSETQLNISFASQLENYGLWHWSIFVLLHIPDKSRRELSIQEILYRYIDLSKDEDYQAKETFIVNQLKIPEKWVYWAKAVRAGAMKRYREQADCLLKAKQWALAHEVIMAHIAPDAIINDNTRYIKDLLDRFEDPRSVPNWSNQALILLDYLDITAKCELLKTIHERDIETRWKGLKSQLSELCSRINLFPCPTSKHRLCQSEIAQALAILANGMEILCSDINPCLLTHKALEKLPLPEEYAKQKIRSLLDNSNLIDMLQND